MENVRAAALFSGGKDSTFSVWKAMNSGNDVVALITVKPLNPESWMFHYPCIDLTSLQSKAMGIPLYRVVTKGDKDDELEDLRKAVAKLKEKLSLDALVSGAVESKYQKTRIDAICKENGLNSITPLWHSQPEELLKEILDAGFEIVFTAVAAEGLTAEWLNRKLDYPAFEDLKLLNRKFGVHVSLEGGEGETFVKDAPFFLKKVEFTAFDTVWNRDSGYLIVKGAILKRKS